MRQGLLQPPTGEAAPEQESNPAEWAVPPDAEAKTGELPEPGEQASAMEQAQYDELMSTFMGSLHSEQMRDKVLERLRTADNVSLVVGEMASQIFAAAEQQITQQGGRIEDAVRMEAGEDLILEIVQIAVVAGIVPDDEGAIGTVMAGAVDVLASRMGNEMREAGQVDPQKMKAELPGLQEGLTQMFGGGQKPMAGAVRNANAGA